MELPEIIITSRTGAGSRLGSTRRGGHIKYVVSIGGGDRDNRPPYGFQEHPSQKLRLFFEDDVYDTPVGPKQHHMEKLVQFLERVDGPVLFHCYAGVSRSTAAAYILLAMWLGPGKEQEAAHKLLEIRPGAHPNPLMLQMAEEILGREGFYDAWYGATS